MANFCKKCGTPSDSESTFCDNCGAPLRTAAIPAEIPAATVNPPVNPATSSTPPPLATAPAIGISRRTLGMVGAGFAVVVMGGAVLAWAFAPERASAASFTRAINEHFASNQAASDRLICASNLPYQTDPIRVDEFDRNTRDWMEMLGRAGVYAPARTESSGGYFPRTQFVYQLTAAGKAAVRNNKLCAASGLQVKSASGFDQVQKNGERSTARATATLEFKQEAPWLEKSPQRTEILQHLRMTNLTAQLPMALVDKKWQVDTTMQSARPSPERLDNMFGESGLAGMAGATGVAGVATAAPSTGVFDKLKSMFSFGGHPLVGKWTDSTGMANFEFTSDSFRQNGAVMSATFTVKGKDVYVTPANSNGVSLVFQMRDADHAALDMGLISIVISRVK